MASDGRAMRFPHSPISVHVADPPVPERIQHAYMGDVEYVSSAGLRVLISVQKTCKRWNRGHLVLAEVPQRVYETLDLAGFLPLFDIFDDVTSAVGNF